MNSEAYHIDPVFQPEIRESFSIQPPSVSPFVDKHLSESVFAAEHDFNQNNMYHDSGNMAVYAHNPIPPSYEQLQLVSTDVTMHHSTDTIPSTSTAPMQQQVQSQQVQLGDQRYHQSAWNVHHHPVHPTYAPRERSFGSVPPHFSWNHANPSEPIHPNHVMQGVAHPVESVGDQYATNNARPPPGVQNDTQYLEHDSTSNMPIADNYDMDKMNGNMLSLTSTSTPRAAVANPLFNPSHPVERSVPLHLHRAQSEEPTENQFIRDQRARAMLSSRGSGSHQNVLRASYKNPSPRKRRRVNPIQPDVQHAVSEYGQNDGQSTHRQMACHYEQHQNTNVAPVTAPPRPPAPQRANCTNSTTSTSLNNTLPQNARDLLMEGTDILRNGYDAAVADAEIRKFEGHLPQQNSNNGAGPIIAAITAESRVYCLRVAVAYFYKFYESNDTNHELKRKVLYYLEFIFHGVQDEKNQDIVYYEARKVRGLCYRKENKNFQQAMLDFFVSAIWNPSPLNYSKALCEAIGETPFGGNLLEEGTDLLYNGYNSAVADDEIQNLMALIQQGNTGISAKMRFNYLRAAGACFYKLYESNYSDDGLKDNVLEYVDKIFEETNIKDLVYYEARMLRGLCRWKGDTNYQQAALDFFASGTWSPTPLKWCKALCDATKQAPYLSN